MLILMMFSIAAAGCWTTTNDRVVIIDKAERIVKLDEGEPAPFDGWLMTDERLIEIYDALSREFPPTP